MPSDRPSPQTLVDPEASVSDNIRKLNTAGFSRSEIAGVLGKSYQQVRNVLVNDHRRRLSQAKESVATGFSEGPPPKPFGVPAHSFMRLDVSVDGRLHLTEALRAALGVEAGGQIVAHVSGEGEVSLASGALALHRARELVRSLVGPGRSLADELIAERRIEAERE
jgi:hypothetical protein